MDDLIEKNKWYLVTIDDPKMARGSSFITIIRLIKYFTNIQYAEIDDIDGFGKQILDVKPFNAVWILQEDAYHDRIFKIDELFGMLKHIRQFFWADFYLFNDPILWEKVIEHNDIDYSISQSTVTVRAIDNQYIYVYTPDIHLVNYLKVFYEIESITFDFVEKLSYPC